MKRIYNLLNVDINKPLIVHSCIRPLLMV